MSHIPSLGAFFGILTTYSTALALGCGQYVHKLKKHDAGVNKQTDQWNRTKFRNKPRHILTTDVSGYWGMNLGELYH